jgi:hypothetical protein
MRFPRMTTRFWMIAVALIALVIVLLVGGGVQLIRHRRDYFLTLAQSHQAEAASSRTRMEALKSRLGNTLNMSDDEFTHLHHDFNLMMDRADHHAELAHKYERAARRPWLPTEPDPPPPD